MVSPQNQPLPGKIGFVLPFFVCPLYAKAPQRLLSSSPTTIIKTRRIAICWSIDRHMALGGAALVKV
jgi:hypothetical protein